VHLIFWVYIVALLSGSASSAIAFFVYSQHRKPVELGFGLFLVSLFLIVASMAVQQYAEVAAETYAVRLVALLLMITGSAGYMFVWPHFYHPLVGSTPPRWLRVLYGVIGVAFLLLAMSVFLAPESMAILVSLNLMLFGMIAYGIVAITVRYRRIGDRRLRRAVRVFLIVSAVFFPLMYLDSILMYLPAIGVLQLLDGTALPTFFIVLNVLAIRFAATYLNEPAYLVDGRISDHFRSLYGISDREGQIIGLLVDGHTGREVAESLYISAKTVENHVYNIYQKTQVRNRVELVNLIQEHRSG
jgi:DNA-binding CsgD family transcriptional regulator